MTWNYRIVRCKDSEGTPYYGLHEVYYDGQGKPDGRTNEPATFMSDEEEGPEGVISALRMALRDAENRPALDDPWA